ncbi:beta-glucosidase [Neobacillus niacini]|uniref:beta-glucosidase family protein n=1 Tax=Neobacillus niacini TaxID=86668 RepID=UPI002857DEF7|nr:glycoside hydrolase family 3 C-terminal domain-containing protein [Neobacillus niacini]MDR7077284.1 beta-glucosidase [Neobacillus niacini]
MNNEHTTDSELNTLAHSDHRNGSFPWMDKSLPERERAEKLLAAMTLEQKIAQLHGAMETINIYALPSADEINAMSSEEQEQLMAQIQVQRHVKGIEELGIPRFRITNGPVGVGMGDGHPSPPATALPMSIALAAGFDPELARKYGDIIGSETATLGQHVLEGPGVCLHRTPIAGRNFEYFSEDPYLSGVMGVEVTKAIQNHNVIAMGKHYVVNDQEYERFRTSVEVDEHVLRELYLLPFEMLVKDADIAAMMSAYNRVRGIYATENRYILNDILRDEWGFKGYVQSDFWSCRSCAASLSAGMDHEMPDAKWCNETNVKNALEDTSLEIQTVNRALVRRFTQMFRFGQFERPYKPGVIDAKEHGAISRKIGSETAVLLKNEGGILPLDPKAYRSIVIIGQSEFVDDACNGGGGSSKVTPLYTVPPVEGMQDVLNGLGSSALVSKVTVAKDLSNLEEARSAANEADLVILMAGLVASEGADLPSPNMLNNQNSMLEELLKVNPHTVLVMKSSSPVLMPWITKAPAVLEAWNQGTEDGHVVADLLFGVVNPSGKVPTTYAASENDLLYSGHPDRYPGTDEGNGFPVIRYSEGLNMGYRWFQSQGIQPLFPFGFGLSYTSFELSGFSVTPAQTDGKTPIMVKVTVTNKGKMAGAEVVQVYLGIPVTGQPPKRLVGIHKVFLEQEQSREVTITIDPSATNHPMSVWDYCERDFVVKAGEYTVYLGTSSEDTAFKAKVVVV